MSAALQRVVVRMLHDPDFRARVFADPAAALAPLALTPQEHALLTRADARAWAVDEHRADRVLTALLAELPVSTLVLLEDHVPLASFYRFFQAAHFHDAIMARRSLAPAFADYLQTLAKHPRARSMITLESAIAALRRARPEGPSPRGRYRIGWRARAVELAAGTLAAWDRARKALGPEPAAALVADDRPKVGAVDTTYREWVLLERPADGDAEPPAPTAGFIGEALGRLLQAAERPVSHDRLIAVAVGEGADKTEANEIIDELVGDELLI